jgi:ABC-type antimicrobial peptide transport system permease subunit
MVSSAAAVQTWRQTMPELVQLISLNQVSINVVLGLALLILAFGVSNTAFMSVGERTREMGILKAMGARPMQIAAGVLGETLAMVFLAGLVGVALGAAAAHVWSLVGLDLGRWTSANRHFLLSGVIYPRTTAYAVLLPGLVAVACGLLAGILPAVRAARINVVQALRWL